MTILKKQVLFSGGRGVCQQSSSYRAYTGGDSCEALCFLYLLVLNKQTNKKGGGGIILGVGGETRLVPTINLVDSPTQRVLPCFQDVSHLCLEPASRGQMVQARGLL